MPQGKHSHLDEHYTKTEIDQLLALKANNHSHPYAALDHTHEDPPPPPPTTDVTINSGDDIRTIVNANPIGTAFLLKAGTHTLSSPIRPKNGQRFMGESLAILTGSNVTPMAFNGEGSSDVTVDGLVIERFNTPIQNGLAALKTGDGWTVTNNEIRHNAGLGVYHESNTTLTNNKIHHNAWSGIGAFKAHNSLIENNEVWENGAGGYRDRGGSKWVGCLGVIVRNNHFHHNYNNGIWLDADNVDAFVEGNLIEDNYDKGLHWEISCSGIWRNNISQRNGVGMFVVACRDTEIYDNQFLDNVEAIRTWHQDRGQGKNCRWVMSNVNIHHNTFRGGRVWSALNGQPQEARFDFNNYEAVSFVTDGPVDWAGWQAVGNDPNGTLKL